MGLFLFIGLIVGGALGFAIGWWLATRPKLMRQRQDKECHGAALQVLKNNYYTGTNRNPLYIRAFDRAHQEVEGVIEGGRSTAVSTLIKDVERGVLLLESVANFDPSKRRQRVAASFQLMEQAEVKKVGYQLLATVEQLQSWIPKAHREEAQRALASMFFDSKQVAAALAAAREANPTPPDTDVVDQEEINAAVDVAVRNHRDTICMESASPRDTIRFEGVRPVLLPQGPKK